MTGNGEYEYEAFNEDGTPVEQPTVKGETAPASGEHPRIRELTEEPVAVASAQAASVARNTDSEDSEGEARMPSQNQDRAKDEPKGSDRGGERSRTTGGKAGTVPPATDALRKRKLFIVALIVFGGFLGWTVMSSDKTKKDDVVPARLNSVGSHQTLKPLNQEAPVAAAVVAPEKQNREELKTSDENDPLLDAARRAPMMAFAGSRSGAGTPATGTPTSSDNTLDGLATMQNPPEDAGENEARRFDNRLKPTELEGTKAGLLGNRNMIIAMGASIPCTLETAIATDQPGFTSCIISRDILSDNGRVVLLDKGTQIVGEYRGGMQRGQKRLFVLWTRAKTPTGVIVQLASPATDALGRAGFDGYVDTHWWERFGSGLLLSMVGDLTTSGLKQIDSKGVSFENTAKSGKDAAAIAVEQSINIPPTLRKHQGELVSIFVARDLDFSSVYRLKPAARSDGSR